MKKATILFSMTIAWLLLGACMVEAPKLEKAGRNLSAGFQQNGNLQVIGTQLCNSSGQPVQLRGMSTHGLQYRGNCYNTASLDHLVNDWNVDILRISMYVQEGGYETNPVFFTNFVDSLVEECYDRGIYALIDWHMLHPGDPNANTELAETFFEHVSAEHADKGNVLYEICNEPNNDNHTVTWAMIKNYAEQIIPIIRNNDPNSVIIVGTPEFASRPDWVIGNALNYGNVMYTMHFYAADPGQVERMGYVTTAINAGIPVFVTEFGTQDGWGDGANNYNMSQKWFDFLRQNKISWCNWNYSDSPRSGAVWKTGTCPNGPWNHDNLKESGVFMKAQLTDQAFWKFHLGSGTGTGGTFTPASTVRRSISNKDTSGYLPYPPTGTAMVSTAASAGAGLSLTDSLLTIRASNGATPNKFSVYRIPEGSPATSVYFTVSFNGSTQGTAVFALGNHTTGIFTNTDAYTNSTQNGLFCAIRFLVGNSFTNPEYRYNSGAGYLHRAFDADLFARTGNLQVELHCNNTGAQKTYKRGTVNHQLPANTWHLYVNNQLVTYGGSGNMAATGELENNGRIDAILFTGAASAANTLNYTVSNIRVERIKQHL